MKKCLILVFSVFSLFAFTATAHAVSSSAWSTIDVDAYMSDKDGNAKTTFLLNETPYLTLNFDLDDINQKKALKIDSLWQFENDFPAALTKDKITSYTTDPVTSMQSPLNWDSIKKVGDWNVYSIWYNKPNFKCQTGGIGAGTFTFTVVTPEPVSSLLFILGGAGLITRRMRRK